MSVRVTLELHLRPDAVDLVIQGLEDQLRDTRGFDGCEEISVVRSQDDPNTLLVLELWATRAHHEAYVRWRTDRGDMDGIAALSTAPHRITYYDFVGI